IAPIGTCHGLNSPNSPRMVTKTTQPKPQLRKSENILMQLPTPLDCIRGTGNEADAFLLGGQHHVGDGVVGLAQLDQPAVAGIRHIADLADADAPEMTVDCVRPGCLYV